MNTPVTDAAVTPAPAPARVRPGGVVLPVVAVAVVILALVVVVLAERGAFNATRTGAQLLDRSHPADGRVYQVQFDAVRRELARQVPAGTRVFIAQPDDVVGWNQRLVEFCVMNDLVIVTRRGDARVELSVDTAHGGARLVVRRDG